MKSRLVLLAVLSGAVVLVGAGSGVGALRRPPSARRRRLPGRDDAGRLLEHGGAVRDRAGRPGGASVRRTSATSSRARRPCTWASSTSPSTTPRWRSRAAISRTRSRSARRDASPEAAIATATHDTLVGLPALGLSPAQQAILDGDYVAYMNAIADGPAKDERHRGRSESGRSRARAARKRRPGEEPDRRRPRPARARARACGNPRPGRCWAFACPG